MGFACRAHYISRSTFLMCAVGARCVGLFHAVTVIFLASDLHPCAMSPAIGPVKAGRCIN